MSLQNLFAPAAALKPAWNRPYTMPAKQAGWGDVENKNVPSAKAEDKPQKQPLPPGVAVNEMLAQSFANGKLADVTFIVGDDEKTRERVTAHRMILALRSPVFEAMLYKFHPDQKSAPTSEITIKGTSPAIFRILLSAMYSDKPQIDPDNVREVMALAKKYQVESVISACTEYVTGGFTPQNVCAWFIRAEENSAESKATLSFIEDNAKAVVATDGFLALKSEDVVRICRRDKLAIQELELFQAVLKWASAELKRQNREEDAKSRADVLKEILPHIRFPTMDMETIANVVSQSGVIASDQLIGLFTYVGQKEKTDQVIQPPRGLVFTVRPREPRKPFAFFKWDAKTNTGNIQVSNDGLTASLADQNGNWHSVAGNVVWKPRTGVYDFEVTLEQYDASNTWNVIIGLFPCTSNLPDTNQGVPMAYNGQPGWGLFTGLGQILGPGMTLNQNNYNYNYGGGGFGGRRAGRRPNTCATGDVIGVRYDSDRATVEFFKRGRPWPEAGANILRNVTGNVRPAVSLVMSQRVKVGFNTKFPPPRSS